MFHLVRDVVGLGEVGAGVGTTVGALPDGPDVLHFQSRGLAVELHAPWHGYLGSGTPQTVKIRRF